jgi:hypothetical protein
MGSLSLNLIPAAAERALPLVFVIGDDWLLYGPWADGWHRRFLPEYHPHRAEIVRRITGPPTTLPDFPRLGQFFFVSEYTRARAIAHAALATAGRYSLERQVEAMEGAHAAAVDRRAAGEGTPAGVTV